ncbi:MAG: lysophospholipid acyltransferase family protein [Polaribacter sp.]
MKFLVYGIFYPIIWLFSKLPFRVLYLISDIFFFFVFFIFKYRKTVVFSNLKLAFPEKTEDELQKIQKKFYHYFIDFFIESLKSLTISDKEIKKRYHFKNIDLINELYKNNRSIALMMAHYGNWEWISSLPLHTKIDTYASYTKVSNIYFEQIVKNYRSKFGMFLTKSVDTTKTILLNHKKGKQSLFVLISDQSPQLGKTQYWRSFFDIKVPVFTGADLIARKFDFAVVNANVKRTKRGFYEIDFDLITDNAKELPKHKVIDVYTEMIEKHIKKQPEFYLWSHKRFKHKDKFEEWEKSKKTTMKK